MISLVSKTTKIQLNLEYHSLKKLIRIHGVLKWKIWKIIPVYMFLKII